MPAVTELKVKCPQCGGQAVLGNLRNNGDRTYVCRRCGGLHGEVTEYALCERDPVKGTQLDKPRVIERDNNYNDCFHCTFFAEYQRAIKRRQQCPFLLGKITWAKVWEEHEDYVKKHDLKNIEL